MHKKLQAQKKNMLIIIDEKWGFGRLGLNTFASIQDKKLELNLMIVNGTGLSPEINQVLEQSLILLDIPILS